MRLAFIIFLVCSPAVHAQEKVAFFGLHLLDMSVQSTLPGPAPAEPARIAALERMVADRFQAEGYVLLDLEPAREQIDHYANLAKCYGCDARIALELGADYSLVGEVQKTSNLIIAMNLQLRDANTGKTVKGAVVDIRGNTDESWTRGMRYILKNRFFKGDTQ
jgi:hypothetical protein